MVGVAGTRAERIAMTDLRRVIDGGEAELNFRFGPSIWEFVRVSPGEFLMGSSAADDADREEGEMSAKQVRITRPFYLAKYQVTQAQYQSVMHSNPSDFHGDDLAIDQVTYVNALEFCRRMSSVAGVPVTLPTEAQWEYACRAGTTTRYYSGNSISDLDRIAWFRGNSENRIHPVGKKEPNAWGLYDMLGNVYEPCLDYIHSFENLASNDPQGQRFADHGAARGGAWMEEPRHCRATSRIQTHDMFGGMGLRLVITS
jgi:formylglycine-generating enzyme required for sulfatase activity